MFSIIIPTLNNLDYLKLCLDSIKKNSKFKHEIIIFINEGSDGTLDFVKKKNIKFIHSHNNVGLCIAVNKGVDLATNKYIVYAHDDMYFCPGWDEEFIKEINNIKHDNFFLSGTMIQPFNSFINLNCGKNFKDFNEKKLLNEYKIINFSDFQGSTWAPSLIPIKTWKKVSGFSEEYTFGLGSDPDFNMKLWKAGVRIHKGLGNSRVYHFGSLSLRKKVWNDGHKIFLMKWGITIKFFKKYYLRSNQSYDGPLDNPKKNFSFLASYFICKIKYIYLKLINFKT
jgi:glycosyltransferase involved in cell wall biosynthesis|tara:strand:+ start:124 stop:969 length:846 start_codon:yes stop_codon:yes gene_type:complete